MEISIFVVARMYVCTRVRYTRWGGGSSRRRLRPMNRVRYRPFNLIKRLDRL